jgi:4-amino-4-deoxy-L-arabinose transferase-like glycosyltransferase
MRDRPDANFRTLLPVLLLIVGAWLRFASLDQYPLGVHQDELSNIYDGYSIAETGADRFGSYHPAVLRAFGEDDYRPSMYAWLAAAPIKLFGFSITAGRLPAAILGTASLVFLYLFATNLGGGEFGLLTLLLGVLSPLHIQYSRVAHEGAILPGFFVIVILYLWERATSRQFSLKTLALLGLVVGLSANAYQSTKLTSLLFAIGISLWIAGYRKPALPGLIAFGVFAVIGVAPQLLVLATDPHHFTARAQVLAVKADNPVSFALTVLHKYGQNLAPQYLFVPRTYSALTVARLLPPEIAFFYAGFIGLALLPFKASPHAPLRIYFAAAVAILPSAITFGAPHTLRTSGVTVLTPLFSAAGIIWLYTLIPARLQLKRFYYPLVIIALVGSSAAIIYRYSRSVMFREAYYQNFLIHLDKVVGRHSPSYDAVILEDYGSEPNVYLAAFGGIKPREFQHAPKRLLSDGMDHFTRLGKFYFVRKAMMQPSADSLAKKGKILFVATSPLRGLEVIDSVKWQNEKSYFMTR